LVFLFVFFVLFSEGGRYNRASKKESKISVDFVTKKAQAVEAYRVMRR
jgi:hypothetical protein